MAIAAYECGYICLHIMFATRSVAVLALDIGKLGCGIEIDIAAFAIAYGMTGETGRDRGTVDISSTLIATRCQYRCQVFAVIGIAMVCGIVSIIDLGYPCCVGMAYPAEIPAYISRRQSQHGSI